MRGFPHQLVWLPAILLLSLAPLQCLHAQDDGACGTKTECSDCIRVPNCKWCNKLKTNIKTQVKCFTRSSNLSDICYSENSDYVENPEKTETIIKDDPISSEANNNKRPVQLRPQEVKLSLRQGEVHTLNVQYEQAEDYPVDLYYLMDLSNSMKEDKKNVARLGKTIAERLLTYTKKVRLGFGSFIDKVALPYVDMQPDKLANPCTPQEPCATPYSFKNDLPLTDDHNGFKNGVDSAQISGNIDSPEGGFDGLMQVMKCKDEIGWDDNVRKIVVFSTDASFHFAGDGKLAGVVIPNDERCHLNATGYYTDFLEYDYPSVSQINRVAKEESINIIFALAGTRHKELYKDLSSEIEASSWGILSSSSSDVVDLVVNQYLAITSKIEIKDNTDAAELGGHLALEVDLKCPNDADYVKKSFCDGLKDGSKVDIRLNVSLLTCPDSKNSKPFELMVQTSQDTIKILVDTLCECGCDSPGHLLNNVSSNECGEGGSETCGVCNCAPQFYGKNCQCKIGEGHTSTDEDKKNCRKDGDDNGKDYCSGNGHCSCGQCQCKEGFSGPLCECSERHCFSGRGEVCDGHGSCNCGTCKCDPGRIGDTCDCPDNSNCFESGSSLECSGEGICDCGECKCNADSKFYGRFCEDCPTCEGGLCKKYKDCAQYKGFETGLLNEQKYKENCSSLQIKVIEDLTPEENKGAKLCTYTDEEDSCLFSFTYLYIRGADKNYDINVKKFKDCPEPPNILAITIGVIASIVAIGLLTLLIWKLLTSLHDQREYAKFQDEMNNSKWQTEQNPLYHSATTTVENPAFNKS